VGPEDEDVRITTQDGESRDVDDLADDLAEEES